MITFLLLAVAFSAQEVPGGGSDIPEEERVGWMVNQNAVYASSNNYNGANCFSNYYSKSQERCNEGHECAWQQKCDEACGYKQLNRDCSGVTIQRCVDMGYIESQCFSYGCICEWTLKQCTDMGYSKESCTRNGCGDASQTTCTCDDKGVQPNAEHGDWCYLAKTPCTLVSGDEVPDWSWARCEWAGKTQLECKSVEQGLADVEQPEEGVGYMVNQNAVYKSTTNYDGPMCWGEKSYYRCQNTPECSWYTDNCEYECAFKDLSTDCSDITISTCVSMMYKEYECMKYGCVCDMSLQQCMEKGYSENNCKEAGCADASQTCTCDDRGRHLHKDGDWCYLASTPCTFLDGGQAEADWTWSDCEFEGKAQVDCPAAETGEEAESVAVKTSDDGPSFAVNAFALLGLGAILYGAGRYYLSK